MIRTRRLLATAAVGAVALILGACGGGGDGDSATGTAATGATGTPVAGGRARILMLADTSSMDPAKLGNAYAATAVVGNALYGTLMIDDDKGQVVHKMAESFTTGDDGATFELRLRPGLVFSDGSPLDAAAVKFNWERLKDPANASSYRGEAALVASTEAVDARTLKISMVEPVPNFAEVVLSTGMNWIASPAALQRGAQVFEQNPVGAGPFKLEHWTRQADIELVKNPRYWDAPRPYLDSLTIRAAVESRQRYNTLLTGGADVAVESDWVNLHKAAEADLPSISKPVNGGIFMALNLRRAPFDDIRARQAVAAALDLQALNLAVYEGDGQPAETLFDDTSPFYSPTPLRRADRAKAQRLFDELAAEGKPVTFTFTSFPSSESRAIAENVQAQLSGFKNVKVQVKVVQLADYGRMNATHDFDTFITSAFFRDPEPKLYTAFYGGRPTNVAGVDDAALNEALSAGRTSSAEPDRKAAYDTVQRRLTELTPGIFLQRVALSAVSGKNVGGLAQYGLGSLLPEELWMQK
ncbi:ABC transporter substrate-binding protein [Parafrankia discariae]|uniref:ABC transporter substrate-binding protein n=1 Tax=Parafrankia discariae TaxID=365528 RepID=UPI00039A23F1|nr:ABC transporter substrate-binding protein [Parafrankia discariae]